MSKICLYCQSNQLKEQRTSFIKDWIVENKFLGPHGRILKEVLVGKTKSSEERKPIKTVYYCSWTCLEAYQDKEEKELWEKGNCLECKRPLAVINENCLDLEHKKLGCLLHI